MLSLQAMTTQSIPFNLHSDPVLALTELCDLHPQGIVFTTSLGLEDQILTDIICRNNLPVRIVTLDTGRLFPETYALIDKTRDRYNVKIEHFFPNTLSLEELVNEQGMNAIFKSVESRKNAVGCRKVATPVKITEGR